LGATYGDSERRDLFYSRQVSIRSPVLMTRGLFFGALDQSKLFENSSRTEAFSIRHADEEEQGLP
jgi:hypothetical protein